VTKRNLLIVRHTLLMSSVCVTRMFCNWKEWLLWLFGS